MGNPLTFRGGFIKVCYAGFENSLTGKKIDPNIALLLAKIINLSLALVLSKKIRDQAVQK